MSYVFQVAFRKALNVMIAERIEAKEEWKKATERTIDSSELDIAEHEIAVLKARYETYKSILERLECLV